VPERDEILEAVTRQELTGQGLDEDSADEAVAAMRDEGMFNVPS
jgi:predicted GNAT family acetyltransferase